MLCARGGPRCAAALERVDNADPERAGQGNLQVELAPPAEALKAGSYRLTYRLRQGEAILAESAPIVRALAAGVASLKLNATGANARLLLNGMPLSLGIAVLHHGDEICFEDGAPIYLSTERRACVETYSAGDAPDCPRCASPIAQGDSVVVCPNCSVIYHQRSDRECFTYGISCAFCDQSSDLTADLRWTPEGI